MRVEWHGQSAFTLNGGSTTVVIDPFQDIGASIRERGMTFEYPPFETAPADLRVVHFGDFGQDQLRPAQAEAIGRPDLLFLPVGGRPTIGGHAAAELANDLDATWVVPMHYRTLRIDFLEDEEEFVAAMPAVQRLDSSSFDTAELSRNGKPLAVIPAAP